MVTVGQGSEKCEKRIHIRFTGAGSIMTETSRFRHFLAEIGMFYYYKATDHTVPHGKRYFFSTPLPDC